MPQTVARLLMVITGMSTVALTIWNDIISPVYDAATTFLLVGKDGKRKTLSTAGKTPPEVAALLVSERVSTMICGAISAQLARLLSGNNIRVIPWTRGNVEEVIDAYLHKSIDAPLFRMPGCGCTPRGDGRGRRCRKRGNHLPERQL